MSRAGRLIWRVVVAVTVLTSAVGAVTKDEQSAPGQRQPVFRAGTELVTVNVVVRDGDGAVVRNLTQGDFSITEDDKPQVITSFDFEQLDTAGVLASDATDRIQGNHTILTPRLPAARAAASPVAPAPPVRPPVVDMHGRRLIVLLFDLSSMQPEEAQRAVKAAHDYIEKRQSPADLIAVASFATSLHVDQDFTSDHDRLVRAVDAYGGANGQGFENGTTGDPEDTADNGNAFTADDTEYNLFNTDRRLVALQSLSDALAGIEQKKSIIYFSSGMDQSGQDNQVELRRTIDRANRSNVSIYAADMRGLQALVPGGDATQGSRRGQSIFSGASVQNQYTGLATTQDTLTTMADDTGGRAFFDANSFGQVFDRVVDDTSAYYVLGYTSTNPSRDGRFRRIRVKLKRSDLKLEYRSGYYAPRDFAHSSRDDREQELQNQLASDLSATDLSAYVATAYFRLGDNRYYVPISVVVPGYQIGIAKATDRTRATLDVLGVLRDAQRRPVGRIRDTLRLQVDGGEDLRRKTVQYETGLEMPPGKFHLKLVVRENASGTYGSYETDVVVPDVKREPLEISSVLMGTQMQSSRKNDHNPLARDGRELVPNVTHVVSTGQHLYFYYEVYDPAQPVKLLTSIIFFRGRQRAFETPLVQATQLTVPDRKSAVFQFDVPASALPPGLYTCQINVVDDAAGTFTFPRTQVYVRR